MKLLLLTALFACDRPSTLDEPSTETPVRPELREPVAIPLARRPDSIEDLHLPASSRPAGKQAEAEFGLTAPFEFDGTYEGVVDVYRSPLPVHSNLLPTRTKGTHVFGSGAPPGLEIRTGDTPLTFFRMGRGPGRFGFDRDWLYVGVRPGAPAPDWQDTRITFPKAAEHENRLNRGNSDLEAETFVARTLTLDATSSTGLFLPAPASATWSIQVPERGVFTTRGTILPPAIRTAERSDGAALHLELVQNNQILASHIVDLAEERWSDVRWDLSDHAGKHARIRVRTEPGATAVYDYVWLEEPTIYPASDAPRRTVLVFVDTLRPDHLGAYGYQRSTSPFIDRWAAHAAVFDQARSVAPWTLPSARSALSGHQPEQWYDVENLAEQFGQAGYATEAIVANAFLSQPFDMHRGWTRFQYEHLWPADGVSQAALEAIDRYPDRDLLLLVHYMDPHLPYEEGWTYRFRWAGFSPDGEAPSRAALYGGGLKGEALQAMRKYVVARYDQNIRFVDDELRAVLEAAGPDATSILFSDHGEEFWEHGSFEHGHSFHDEVLKIPLIVRSPHVPPGRYEQPVSILDIAPTALELAGIEVPEGPGRSLVDLVHGGTLEERPQAFGRPLYEQDGWAVLHDGKKWIDRAGERRLYDVLADPGEEADIARGRDLDQYPGALAEALDREVRPVWRLRAKVRQALKQGFTVTISHPLGFSEAWPSYDPRGRAADTVIEIDEQGSVVVTVPPGAEEAPNAVFLVPNDRWDLPAGLRVHATAPSLPPITAETRVETIQPGPQRNILVSAGSKGWSFLVDTANTPERSGVEVSGFHADAEEQLRELGYLDE